MKRISAVLVLALLVACPAGNGPTPPDTDSPNSSSCTNVLRGSVDLPTTLVDTPSTCDYLLEGELAVKSTLTIEPGVNVRATLNSRIVVREADLIAVGTADKRITFEGQEQAQGYWGGILLDNARPSRIEYVDVKDGGQTCEGCEGGLQLDNVITSLTNSTVSNSFVNGLAVDKRVEFSAFANNRFYGNAFAGVQVDDGEVISSFDRASDYLGVAKPNGLAYVNLRNVALTRINDHVWRKLNAPYYVWSYLLVEGGSLTLEPGVEIIFKGRERDAELELGLGAEVRAVGTADEPIIFRGERAEREIWKGAFLYNARMLLKHVHIQDGFRAARLENSTVEISESTVTNATSGFGCHSVRVPSYLRLGSDVTFDVVGDDISGCTVEEF